MLIILASAWIFLVGIAAVVGPLHPDEKIEPTPRGARAARRPRPTYQPLMASQGKVIGRRKVQMP
jgi:hypothetical protein